MSERAREIAARALWLTGPRRAELREERVPAPGPGEVRVHAVASALSQGTEMLVYRGQVPRDLPLDLPTLAGSFAFPVKYGYASVGRVMDVGAGVEGLAQGDVVFVHYPHQSRYIAPAAMAVKVPPGLAPELAVFVANVETAVNVLLDTPVKLGESTLVFGQGTVGLLIAQLVKRAGARVLVVEPLERRRELARAVGADEVLAPGEDLVGRVKVLTGGRGADVAIEASGSGAALQAAIDAVADDGTAVAVSWYGEKPVTLTLGGHFHRGRVTIRSSQVGHVDPALAPRWDRARRLELALALLPELRLVELISHRIPFAQAPAAYRLVDERPEEATQVVLMYEDTE